MLASDFGFVDARKIMVGKWEHRAESYTSSNSSLSGFAFRLRLSLIAFSNAGVLGVNVIFEGCDGAWWMDCSGYVLVIIGKTELDHSIMAGLS